MARQLDSPMGNVQTATPWNMHVMSYISHASLTSLGSGESAAKPQRGDAIRYPEHQTAGLCA